MTDEFSPKPRKTDKCHFNLYLLVTETEWSVWFSQSFLRNFFLSEKGALSHDARLYVLVRALLLMKMMVVVVMRNLMVVVVGPAARAAGAGMEMGRDPVQVQD